MGGYFGAVSKRDVVLDVFYGTDYHSHLGTKRGGIAVYDEELGFQREIHNIENTPFRTKFAGISEEFKGNASIGCISDTDPQPILIRSNHGNYALVIVGAIRNAAQLVEQYLAFSGGHFEAMSKGRINQTEIIASLIDQKSDFASGIEFAQSKIEGSASIAILTEDGSIICARDKYGRTPMLIGKDEEGYAFSFESFAYEKLGYETVKELGPGEIVEIKCDGLKVLKGPGDEMKICAFLWTYYGYPNSTYEDINVEVMRNKNGHLLAELDRESGKDFAYDSIAGVPDSGIPHAIGYANECGIDYARPFIKYTPTWPRSFMPTNQQEREMVAKMKQVPVTQLIKDKKLLFVDDSIVRGTQLKGTVDFLFENGAKEVHMRSACPPIMYGCKYLNFSRSNTDLELIARRIVRELEGEEGDKHLDEYADGTTERGKALRKALCEKFNFNSLEYQSIDNIIKAIGLDRCKVCTYCWDGKE
ncbi:MAG: amidophosphoribosyltransferase [Clostridia bacterium]|nr:amidophosphoribosyltransferase [Clostridia bacterium]